MSFDTMDNTQRGTGTRRQSFTHERLIGLTLGLAAAVVGVQSPIEALPLRPWRLLVLLALVIAVDKYNRSNRRSSLLLTSVAPVVVGVAIFIAGSVVVEAYNASQLRYDPIFVSLVEPVFWFLSFVAACLGVRGVDSAVAMLRGFVAPALLAVPLAVAQTLEFEPIISFTTAAVSGRGVADLVEEGELLRAGGLVGGWTSFGAYLSGVFAAAIALVIVHRRRFSGTPKYEFAILAFCIIGLLTTLTFSTAIAFVMILIGSNRGLRSQGTVLAAAVGAGIVAYIAFGSRIRARFEEQFDGSVGYVDWLPEWVPNTLGYRIYVWVTQTIPSIMERPSTGWGNKVYVVSIEEFASADIDRVRPTGLDWTSPESQWLWTIMNSGVLGLILLVALIVGLAVPVLKARRNYQLSWLAVPVMWLLLANLAIGFTAINVTNKGLPGVLWPLVGMLAALIAFVGSSEKQSLHERCSRCDPSVSAQRPKQGGESG